MNLGEPTGTGTLEIMRISVASDETTLDFEGHVDGYGSVFATHALTSVDQARTRGVIRGEARTFLSDDTFITTPHCGTFVRRGSSLMIYFTDAVNNGAVNFVMWDVDILSKKVELRYWELESAD